MLPHLRDRTDLCLIANSARLALEPLPNSTNLILIGGQFRTDRMDLVGPIAAATLEQLHGFIAFIGADGASMDIGPTASDPESAHINRLAVRHAREAILVVDHSKLTRASVFRIVDWEPVSRVVTDREPPPDWREFFEERDVDVVFPESAL
jgi:DeoR family deoxyribose operon repressor